MKLSARLMLSYLLVILLGMGLAAALAWLAVENLYLETQRASLLAQAKVAAAALQGTLPAPDAPLDYNQASNTLPGLHTRVIDAQGAVVIDLAGAASAGGVNLPQLAQNAAGLVTPQELLARPEIAAALAGQAITAERRVEVAAGGRVLYAAAPVFAADGQVAQIVYLATPLPDTQWAALPEGLRWQFIGMILFGALLTGAVGLLLARRIARPLGRLAQAAGAVAAGDLEQSVPQDAGIAELAALGQAFNRMTASLRQSDQARTAFISDVSHELRTPLTVIKGTIETLQDGALDDLAARGPFLESMDRETERLIRLVNDLLVLTRADAGALNLRLQGVDLGSLVRARCAALQSLAAPKGVTLIAPEEGEPYPLLADPDRLAQVLDNLLDNAIRYSPPGGEVMVRLSREEGRLVCQVADRGPGIPAQHLARIFDRVGAGDRAQPGASARRGGDRLQHPGRWDDDHLLAATWLTMPMPTRDASREP
jgi:signal transduction histidine kinase